MDMPLAAGFVSAQRLPAEPVEIAPLVDTEFGGLMAALGPFEYRPLLAVAVSGGPDSLALTLLASRWARSRDGKVVGLTVDHGLRTASAEEARQTGRWLKDYGIEHHSLTWAGPKPLAGLQQQAREARYDLLTTWCRQAGILHLLTAHHRQDQAETVALRKARQSGANGLAGMAAIRDLRALRLLRPLLGVDKDRLMATLDQEGQRWIDDPTNRNLEFTRNRLRHDGLDIAGLASLAGRCGREREAADRKLHAALVTAVVPDPAGFARLSCPLFDDLPAHLADSLVPRVLMTIGGTVYPPRSRSLERLLHAMRHDRTHACQTLSRCRIHKQKGQWLICREGASSPALALVPGQWQNWDNRFLIRSRSRLDGLAVRQLGDQAWAMRNKLIEKEKMRRIPAAARSSLPSLWQGENLLAIPHLGLFARSFDPSVLDLKFRPAMPLANAPFAAHMC